MTSAIDSRMIPAGNSIPAQFDNMESVIGYYWHYRSSLEEAIDCKGNPDCPRHGGNTDADRARIASMYQAFMADLSHHIVNVYEQTQEV